MKITVADNAGFCFGVSRAVQSVYDNIKLHKKLCTYGEIIHNSQVVEELKMMGVDNSDSIDDILKNKDTTIVIRAHGVPEKILKFLSHNNISYIDSTCPFVKKIQTMAKKFYKNGYQIIIIGDSSHPEVIGINGHAEDKSIIINELSDINNIDFKNLKKICIVVQTTFNIYKFKEIVEAIQIKATGEVVVNNTICSATDVRQKEAEDLSKKMDKMIIIGGKHSSNTKKLYEICKKFCKNTFLIEYVNELDLSNFGPNDNIGITAGASTPSKIIEEVKNILNSESEKYAR